MSREKILEAIKKNKPAPKELPEVIGFASTYTNLTITFAESIRKAGGELITVQDMTSIPARIRQALPGMQRIADLVNESPDTYRHLLNDPASLEVVVLKGRLAVAENGAIWLHESDCVNRVYPFITQHLVLIVEQHTLVGNMHEAYVIMGNIMNSYGVFIAGPSKTADIEQSLVIGAHGARSLLVFLVGPGV